MQTYFTGIVENRNDPLKDGRVQVRIHGLHTADKNELPTADLPWAVVVAGISDASLNGIGSSPTGVLQGSTVLVVFADPFQQYPIVLGTIGGIPQSDQFQTIGNNNINVLSDGQAPTPVNPLPPSSPPAFTPPVPSSASTLPTLGVSSPSAMTISEAGVSLIQGFESLRLTSYQDSVGVWTIGYGSTSINGSPVVANQVITQSQATAAFTEFLQSNTVPIVQTIQAPLTQQMFDACCSLAYNIGSGAFSGSTLKSVLDSAKYHEAAEHFLDWDKGHVNGALVTINGLFNRRSKEQSYFLSGGVPDSSTGTVTPASSGAVPAPSNATVAPFVPGVSNSTSQQSAYTSQSQGFVDPDGKWPAYYNEPDTNRLARAEQLGSTIVFKKNNTRITGIPADPHGLATWDQPHTPYNAQYPFNKVYATESGHVIEYDDTPHSERIHEYHRSGTFREIDCNGTLVTRIIGDNYEILERNGFLYIKGNASVTIDGSQSVYIKNSLNLYVAGNVNLECQGNMTQNVQGSFALKAQSISMEAYGGDFDTKASGNMNVVAGGTINEDGAAMYTQSGTSSFNSVLGTLATASNPVPTFDPLYTPTASSTVMQNYDEPDSGDSTAFVQNQVAMGNVGKSVLQTDKITVAPAATPTSTIKGTVIDCSKISGMKTYPPSLQISPNFTMGTYTKNGSRPLINQFGLTPPQIATNIVQHANNVTEKVYAKYPTMQITSGFRRPGDVAASAKHSQHYLGQAADFFFPNADRARLLEIATDLAGSLDYDQLLLENLHGDTGWIHISYNPAGNRKQCLTLHNNRVVAQGLALVTDTA